MISWETSRNKAHCFLRPGHEKTTQTRTGVSWPVSTGQHCSRASKGNFMLTSASVLPSSGEAGGVNLKHHLLQFPVPLAAVCTWAKAEERQEELWGFKNMPIERKGYAAFPCLSTARRKMWWLAVMHPPWTLRKKPWIEHHRAIRQEDCEVTHQNFWILVCIHRRKIKKSPTVKIRAQNNTRPGMVVHICSSGIHKTEAKGSPLSPGSASLTEWVLGQLRPS